jgi:RHS repeat-associated protein
MVNGQNSSLTFTYRGVGRCIDQCMPPIITLPSGDLTFTEKQTPQLVDPAATVVDFDSPTFGGGLLTIDFSANGLPEDAISIRNQGTGVGQIGLSTVSGVTSVTYGGVTIGNIVTYLGDNPLQVAFNSSSTREAVTALLQNITYQDASCNPSVTNRTLRIVMSDGGGCTSTPVFKTIHVVAVNDQPTLADLPNISVLSCSAPITVQLSGITAGCSETQALTVTATSSVPGLIPNPTVAYTSPNTTGILTLAPTGTGIGATTISVTVQDNGGTASGGVNTITKSFNVTVLNCVPIIAFQSTLTYTENNPPSVIDAIFQLSDPDSPNFNGGSLTYDFVANGQAEDRLGIQAAGGISVNGQNVSYQGVQIGTFNGGTVIQPLVIAFNANATPAAALALSHNITYYNVSDTPSSLTRTVRAVLNDGAGGVSAPTTTSIFVIPVNDAPVANPDFYSVAQGATLTILAPGVLGNDTDKEGDTLMASVVTGPTHGTLNLSANGSFTYQPAANNTSTSDSFIYRATDSGTTGGQPDPKSSTATVTISITPPTCVAQGISISLNQNTVQSGGMVGGMITLSAATTLLGGQVVNLTSDTASAVPPISVLIPQGGQTASFTVQTHTVAADTTATITASYPGKPSQTASLTITAPASGGGLPQDPPPGFTFSLFADGLDSGSSYGPIGMVKNKFGQVLVTVPALQILVLLPDQDGQHYDSTVTPTVNLGEFIFGLARLGDNIYGGSGGEVVELADDGSIARHIPLSCTAELIEGFAANPINQRLYAATGEGRIYEIDPVTGDCSIIAEYPSGNFDGMTISPDGRSVFVADQNGNFIRGFDIASGASIFAVNVQPPHGGLIDGLAIGQGTLANKMFANCTMGDLMVVDLNTGIPSVFSSQLGGRGDLVMVDDDGSLLLTQNNRILRLTPPAGSSFGAIKGTICVRNDSTNSYPSISLNTAGPNLEVVSAQAGDFDVRGLSGNVVSAYISRAGASGYTANNVFQVEYGVAPFDPQNNNPNKDKSYPPQAALAAANPGNASYSPSWLLPSAYLQNIQVSLGGDYQVLLADRISSICGTVTLTDTPQSQWPQARNTLTFLATGTANPQIPAGSSLDMALFGSDVPLNGDWDIVLNGSIVASSGNRKGWNVELDQTPYGGAIVSVPITATIANGYEVRVAETLSKSGTFDVVPASSVIRAPTLLPIALSANPVSAGGSVNITVGLDQPAPPSGVTVYLSSDNASAAVPASVQIAGGASANTITVAIPSGASTGTANITASFNGTRRAALKIITGTGTPPAAPTPTATAAPNQVTLTWSATSGLTYNIKRSRNPGGPYTSIFAGLNGSSYVDTGVINGLTYYYVVSAQNNFGEGPNSVEVSATPVLGQVADPVISYNSGQVTLSDATIGAIIHYTLDGTEPTVGSAVFKSPFSITTTTTIKAKAFKTGYLPSNTTSQTETITISPLGTSIPCGYYSTSESLSSSSDRSWLRGQSFYANHYSLGNFPPNSKIVITMVSSQVNSFLYLFDDSGNMLASNDDDGTGGVNSKIVYTVPGSPTANGYFIEATTSFGGQLGTYTLFLDCGTTPPQIVVTDSGNNSIANGATISVGTSGNVFPNTLATFGLVIKNGASPSAGSGLNLGRLQMTGDFAVDQQLIPEIPPQQSSGPITVGLIASTLGAKQGTLTIPNDDPTKNPFVIHFSSTVVDPNLFPSVSITSPVNNETIPDGTFPDPNSILIQASATATEFPTAAVEVFATLQGQSAVKIGQATAPPYSMTWIGAAPTSGSRSYTLTAKVTDTAGRQTSSSSVAVTVNAPTLGGIPSISPAAGQYQGRVTVTIDPNTLPSGSTIIYTTDTSSSAQWYVYQQPIVFSYSDFGGAMFTLQAKGVKNGVSSAIASATYTITPPGQTHPPDAQILSPASGDQITSAASVTGVAQLDPADPGSFGSWRLEYRPHSDNSSPWVIFATGTSPVSSGAEFDSNHKFDPTLLLNGLYDIRLTVMNAAGDVSIATVVVDVEGRQKVGNFTLSFVDMTVPIAGIPIQVTRTYDSRDKGQGDFGIGWRLSVSAATVQTSGPLGEGWDQVATRFGFFPGFELQALQSHRVTITLPGDFTYSFEESLDPETSLFEQIPSGRVIFNPLPGTYGSLQAVDADPDVDLNPSADGGYEFDSSFNGSLFNPTEFDLTTAEGRTLRVKVGVGLESITELNGNVITFQSDGIFKQTVGSTTPTSVVTYTREPAGGLNLSRITAVTDPNGKSVQYTYGTSPQSPLDLVKVTDRVGNPTTYSYDAFHDLIDIISPNGSHGVRTVYDDSGRITQSIDALNNVTTYAYGPNSEMITDPLGNITSLTYDSNGNITQKSETVIINGTPTIVATNSEFADPSNPNMPTKIKDALGRVTTMTYSSGGHLLTQTDPLGNTITHSYDNYGELTSYVDASGQAIVQNGYDNHGNLTSVQDATGGQITAGYNLDGTIFSSADALGNATQYSYGENVSILDPNSGAPISVAGDPAGTGMATTITDANSHQKHFVYDNAGNKTHEVITRTLNNGSVETIDTVNQFDDAGRITQTTVYAHVPGQAVQSQVQVQNFYTDMGELDHSIDSAGQTTSYTYDEMGRLISTTTPDGNSEVNAYDANGNKVSVTVTSTDGRHLITSYGYDSLRRQVSTTYPDGSQSFAQYDLDGELTNSIDANGNSTQYVYDDAGHGTKVTDALGHATTYEYDQTGRRVSMTDANGNKTVYAYDAAGRLTNTVFPPNSQQIQTSQSVIYDILGRRIAKIDGAGVITGYGYDALGRMTYVTNAFGTADQAVTQYQYDEVGNLVKQFDANQYGKPVASQVATIFDYDFLARRIKRTLPSGQVEQTAYTLISNPHGGGNVAQNTITDFNGHTTTIVYDVMGRAVNEAPDPGLPATVNVPIAITYDLLTGNKANMTDASGTTTYAYDTRGRLITKSHTMSDLTTVLDNLSYTYDANGNLRSINSSRTGGVSLTYLWDALNRLSQVDDNNNPNNKSTKYDYDNVGNLKDFVYPTSQASAAPVRTTYTYDNLNCLTSMNIAREGSSPATLAAYGYTLGLTGNRTVANENIYASPTISRLVNYSYDNLYRLTKEQIANDPVTTGTIDYRNLGGGNNGYDKVGNRQSRVVSLTPPISGFGTANSTFDSNDRLIGSTYDANGNTLVETPPALATLPTPISPTVSHTDQYDFHGRLIQRSDGTHTVSIVYDGDGNRILKTVNGVATYYLIDDRNPSGHAQVLEELTPNGSSLQLNRSYNYGLSLISEQQGGGPVYYGYDGHGNVRFLVAANGNITDTYTYDAFGMLIARSSVSGITPNNHLYCGEECDSDLGLYYLRARYFNPGSGRFWTMDSFEGNTEEPPSLHKYLYVQNDPIDAVDPLGFARSSTSGKNPFIDLGDAVEQELFVFFKIRYPISFQNKSIITILKLSGKLRLLKQALPDLVGLPAKCVFEVKPANPVKFLEGEIQLGGYILVFNYIDRTLPPWHEGTFWEFEPPGLILVPVPPFLIVVYPPVFGVIMYEPFEDLVKRLSNDVEEEEEADIEATDLEATETAVMGAP